ncbi:MAG: DUF4956 domain-containing protein, partial [Oscillospiraceae bacterium]|nr:DUF4956 domain-containing protein [Oscillospiraceae bacterium]
MFTSILNTDSITLEQFLICSVASLGFGALTALSYMAGHKYSRSFVGTLMVLPVMVQAVIMMVNGNVGTGVAVLGAFSLVRFRSVPGNSRDISAIFLAMAVGIATGMGQIGFGAVMTLVVCADLIVVSFLPLSRASDDTRELKITIPEDLDYEGAFDDILKKYTAKYTFESAKTTNMGSLYEIKYSVIMGKNSSTKAMMDEIRTRNGNLTVSCG